MQKHGAYHQLHTLYRKISKALGIRAFKLFCYDVIGSIPWVGKTYRRRFLAKRGRISGKQLDLCIEGFPRSANSFFTHWFQLLNPEVKVAHHAHDIECVRLAFDDVVPTVILIRKPLDAATSWAIMTNSEKPASCLDSWIKFYHWLSLQPTSKYILVYFSEAICPTAKTISKINAAFDTKFKHSNEDADLLYKKVRERISNHASRNWEGEHQMRNIPMPDSERDEIKDIYREKLKLAPCLAEAEALYDMLISRSPTK